MPIMYYLRRLFQELVAQVLLLFALNCDDHSILKII